MRLSKQLWLAAAGVGMALVVVPAVGKALLPTESCLAFAGTMPTFPEEGAISWARQIRADVLAEHGLSMPKPPYVVVSRHMGDVGTDLLIATRTSGGWQVEEAGRPLEEQKGHISSGRGARPMSASSSRRLDTLMAKTCLFREPTDVDVDPRAWLELSRPRPGFWDGEGRFVEINDGVRAHSSVQGSFCGITGAVGQVVVEAARGRAAPPQRCGSRNG